MSQAVVDQVNGSFPELLRANTNETCAVFCYRACQALGPDWHLLGKSGGENGHTWPNGTRTSHDAICRVNATGAKDEVVDIIVGAGSGSPAYSGWGDIPSHEWRASNTPVPLSAVPAVGGGTPTPTTPPDTPSTEWTAAHVDVLRKLLQEGIVDTRRISEQFAAAFPSESWGQKKAGEGRPVSKDVIARQNPFIGFKVVGVNIASPPRFDLAGQVFVAVSGVDHLGIGSAPAPAPPPIVPSPAPTPAPTPTPTPTPTPNDVQAVIDALAAVQRQLTALDAKLSAVQFPSYEGTIRAFGSDLPITLRPKE